MSCGVCWWWGGCSLLCLRGREKWSGATAKWLFSGVPGVIHSSWKGGQETREWGGWPWTPAAGCTMTNRFRILYHLQMVHTTRKLSALWFCCRRHIMDCAAELILNNRLHRIFSLNWQRAYITTKNPTLLVLFSFRGLTCSLSYKK